MLSSDDFAPRSLGILEEEQEEEEEADDEEQSVLLYNIANNVAESILSTSGFGEHDDDDGDGDDEEDLDQAVNAISDAFSSFTIVPPMLKDFSLALHVQFWDENGCFSFELDEIMINRSVIDTYCSSFMTKPVRARMDFAESGIEEPTHEIPERGTINLIVTIYAQAPTLVGIICEPYDLSGQDREVQPDGEAFQTSGKRIHWLAEALSSKRQRTSLVSEGKKEIDNSTQPQDLSDMFLGMTSFGQNEYCTTVNSDAAVIGFSFTQDTKQLCEVRIALALHRLVLRLALQSVLDNSRNVL